MSEKSEDKKALVVNLFAGPGTGKSTCMAGLFSELKLRGVNCEMAPEFAKEKVWEQSFKVLENQIYVFGKQLHTIKRVEDQVETVITDSPLLLSIIYDSSDSELFKALVFEVFNKQNNLNIFLTRKKAYNQSGRMQNEEQAREIDDKIRSLLYKNKVDYIEMESGRDTIAEIADKVIERIGEDKQQFA